MLIFLLYLLDIGATGLSIEQYGDELVGLEVWCLPEVHSEMNLNKKKTLLISFATQKDWEFLTLLFIDEKNNNLLGKV